LADHLAKGRRLRAAYITGLCIRLARLLIALPGQIHGWSGAILNRTSKAAARPVAGPTVPCR
jgi:hypothetical protein